MPLIQINAGPEGPELNGARRPLWPTLRHSLRGAGPVIVMVHGYKFQPGDPHACPHHHILSLSPRDDCRKAVSWPRALGFGGNIPDEGLGIGFGWPARGSLWNAYRQAACAGRALAALLGMIHDIAPTRPVHAIAHSLGARVILSALRHPGLCEGSLNRVILLSGAAFSSHAEDALCTAAGRAAEIVNVTSRENDVYDFLLEQLITAPVAGDQAIGSGMPDVGNAVTLQLDQTATRCGLARAGFAVGPDHARMCHWSTYLKPGAFDLYHALLRRPHEMTLDRLRSALPAMPEPRWSRLRRRHLRDVPLPMGQKAAS